MSFFVSDSNKAMFEKIKALPCFVDSECQISPLTEGESHLCFKVTLIKSGIEKCHFVKSLADHQLTYSAEINSHLIAAENGLAPRVIFYSSLWLVSEFIDGHSLRQFCMKHPDFLPADKITIAMSLMAKNHHLKPSIEHSVINIVELLTDQINSALYTQQQTVTLSKIIKKITSFQSSNNPLVLCHGDLNDENIRLESQFEPNHLTDKTWLVDFECSGLAEAEYDVAMYLAINQLPVSNIDEVINSYHQYSTLQLNHKKVRGYLACCYLINGLWYLEAGVSSKLANTFRVKARQQFELFDQLALEFTLVEENVVPLFNQLLAN
jgi:thiamine kinase-like enzyme